MTSSDDPLEKKIEKDLGEYAVKKKGCLYYKFTSPANRGVPDRVIISPKGRVLFLELKRKGKVPTSLQAVNILNITERGADARWTDNLAEAKQFIDEICS